MHVVSIALWKCLSAKVLLELLTDKDVYFDSNFQSEHWVRMVVLVGRHLGFNVLMIFCCLLKGIQHYLYENNRIDSLFHDVYYTKFAESLNELLAGFEVRLNAHGTLLASFSITSYVTSLFSCETHRCFILFLSTVCCLGSISGVLCQEEL